MNHAFPWAGRGFILWSWSSNFTRRPPRVVTATTQAIVITTDGELGHETNPQPPNNSPGYHRSLPYDWIDPHAAHEPRIHNFDAVDLTRTQTATPTTDPEFLPASLAHFAGITTG